MTVIVCVCDGGGMLFGKRRVSRDKTVTEDIVNITADGVLFVSEYTAGLFADSPASVIAVSEPLESAQDGDFAFIEERGLYEYRELIDELIIYRWNRKYLFELKLDIDPEREGMTLVDSVDFKGNSHEKITREIWRRKE